MKTMFTSAKNFVVNHKFAIASTTTVLLTAVVVIQRGQLESAKSFLTENNLWEDYSQSSTLS